MENVFYDLKGQKERAALLNRKLFEFRGFYYDEEYNWKESFRVNFREHVWMVQSALALGTEESVAFANGLLHKISKSEYDLFSALTLASILLKYRDSLAADNEKWISNYIFSNADVLKHQNTDFVGVNDNFPCMAVAKCFLFAKLLGRQDIFDEGIKKLKQLEKLLIRRGTVSEFASPTYTPIQIHAIAEAAEFTEGETRRRLLAVEHRLWFDVLARFHRETSLMGGPYSRAYNVDSNGGAHLMNALYYVLLGDRLTVSPLSTFFSGPEGAEREVVHGAFSFMQINASDIVNTVYHCPADLVEQMCEKQYPFEYRATYEVSSCREDMKDSSHSYCDPAYDENLYEYPCLHGFTHTYMEKKYVLGAATVPFHNGVHSDLFHLAYRKPELPEGYRQIRTIFPKYSINGELPTKYRHFDDKGRKVGIMDKNSVLLLYKPKAQYAKGVSSLRLSLCLLSQFAPVDEIYIGSRRVKFGEETSVNSAEQIFISDGGVYSCFTPLILFAKPHKQKETKTTIQFEDDFAVISFYSYDGREVDLKAEEMLTLGSGFGAEIRQSEEYESFEAFRKQMSAPDVTDLYTCNEHSRHTYMRHCIYQNGGSRLEIEYNPSSEGVRYATVNGKPAVVDRIQIDGFDSKKLPLIK